MVETTEIDERDSPSTRAHAFNPNVHGARGLFSLGILVFHVANSGLPTFPLLAAGPLHFFLAAGEHCVELFFAISGFVIVGALQRARGPLQFLKGRAIRIFPVLWVSIIVLFIYDLAIRYFSLLPQYLLHDAILLSSNALALPGVFHLELIHPAAWSLSYEMCFYALCAVLWLQERYTGVRWAYTAIPAGLLLVIFYPRAGAIPIGALIAFNYGLPNMSDSKAFRRLARFPIIFLLIFLACWHGIQIMSGRPLANTTLVEWASDGRGILGIIGAVSLLIGMAAVVDGNSLILCPILRARAFQWLGTVSYSLYLWHPIVLGLVKRALKSAHIFNLAGEASQMVFLVVGAGLSFGIAHISQEYLEARAGRWLTHRR